MFRTSDLGKSLSHILNDKVITEIDDYVKDVTGNLKNICLYNLKDKIKARNNIKINDIIHTLTINTDSNHIIVTIATSGIYIIEHISLDFKKKFELTESNLILYINTILDKELVKYDTIKQTVNQIILTHKCQK